MDGVKKFEQQAVRPELFSLIPERSVARRQQLPCLERGVCRPPGDRSQNIAMEVCSSSKTCNGRLQLLSPYQFPLQRYFLFLGIIISLEVQDDWQSSSSPCRCDCLVKGILVISWAWGVSDDSNFIAWMEDHQTILRWDKGLLQIRFLVVQ